MNERQMQFRVGVVVFATMIIGVLLATLNSPLPTGWLPWGRLSYDVGISLEQAPGVGPNTPVLKNGILIGRVESIEDKEDGVLLNAEIDGNRPLYAQYTPAVRTSVLGDATINFKTRPLPPGVQPVEDGYIFRGEVEPNPFDAIADFAGLKEEFASAARSLGDAGEQVSKLAERVNSALGDETEEGRVSRLLDTTERAMNQFAATMSAFNEIIGDGPADYPPPQNRQRPYNEPPLNQRRPGGPQPLSVLPAHMQQPGAAPPVNPQRPLAETLIVEEPVIVEGSELRRRLRQGLNELPEAVREVRLTMRHFNETLDLADRNLRNLEGFTEPLGQKGEVFVESLLRAVDGVDRLVETFDVLVQALNNREGTIGRLIHDPQTYENLNRLMCNANQVLGQIHQLVQRLRPVVEDARIAMDKIAREPGRVVTGGLNPSPIK